MGQQSLGPPQLNIKRELGRGANAIVLLAEGGWVGSNGQSGSGQVAVKLLLRSPNGGDPTVADQKLFMEEAQCMAAISRQGVELGRVIRR